MTERDRLARGTASVDHHSSEKATPFDKSVFSPEVWTYLDDADDIAEFSGYGKLRGTFGKADSLNLRLTAMVGKGFDHGSVQLDLTYPVHVGFLDMSVFAMAQYFNGYGESLLSYDRKTESLRFGFAFVR